MAVNVGPIAETFLYLTRLFTLIILLLGSYIIRRIRFYASVEGNNSGEMAILQVINGTWKFLTLIIVLEVITCQGDIRGEVVIKKGTTMVSSATIDAGHGSTRIGSGNVIKGKVKIINRSDAEQLIGDGNVFHGHSTCEALKIGNGNVIRKNAHIGKNAILGDHCVVNEGCRVEGMRSYGNNEIFDC